MKVPLFVGAIAFLVSFAPARILCAQDASPAPGATAPRVWKMPASVPPPAGVIYTPNVVYGNSGGQKLLLDLAMPQNATGALPAVVFVHGGGWVAGHKILGQWSIYTLAKAGYVAVSVEYRLISPTVHLTQALGDCKCAVRFLRANAAKYHVDPKHIGAMGSSAGGHLVSMMGVTNGDPEFQGDGGWADQSSAVQAVVDWFGPADPGEWIKGKPQADTAVKCLADVEPGDDASTTAAKLKKIDVLSYLIPGRDYPPFLILHGLVDQTVPHEQSEAFAKALSQVDKDVTLHLLPGMNHGRKTLDDPQWSPEVIAFFNRTLK